MVAGSTFAASAQTISAGELTLVQENVAAMPVSEEMSNHGGHGGGHGGGHHGGHHGGYHHGGYHHGGYYHGGHYNPFYGGYNYYGGYRWYFGVKSSASTVD